MTNVFSSTNGLRNNQLFVRGYDNDNVHMNRKGYMILAISCSYVVLYVFCDFKNKINPAKYNIFDPVKSI